MTCIVALVHDNISYIGGERGASNDEMIWHTAKPKVWRDKGYLFGYAGSFSIEKLKHNFDPPAPPSSASDSEIDEFMNTTFIDALKDLYEELDISKKDAGLVIVVNNRIFIHNSEDMSATMLNSNYFADGTGSSYAVGSLYTSEQLVEKWFPAKDRVCLALEAAIQFSPSCSGDIDVISTENWDWENDL